MKIKNLLAGMVLLGTSTFTGNIWAADWGPCRTASGDPFIFVTSFTKNIQNPTDNVTGQTYPDFYQWALGDKYSGVCECPSPNPTEARPTLYKTESTLARGITQPILKLPIILRFQPGYILQTWGMYRFHLSINQIASQEESAINQLLAGLQGVKDSSHFISLNLLLGNKTFRKLL
ncbi:putative minor fimbrial subunit (fragment) [Escherichia coli]|uniref:Putative minor fimbrial subunit n=1 Tax=Escherichia coli TaxID=562 RepID=A0A376CXR5_ECOLX